jgi:hypothetical protein
MNWQTSNSNGENAFQRSGKTYNSHQNVSKQLICGIIWIQRKAYFNAVEGADKPVE